MNELSYTTNMARKITAVILVAILPGVFITSAYGAGVILLAQANSPTPSKPIPGLREAEYLADKSMAYWFIALAVFAITSWTFLVKWLIQQLESQRAANAESVKQLVTYISTDHTNAMVVMSKVTDVLERVLDKLNR